MLSPNPPAGQGGDPGTMTCFVDNVFPREAIDYLNGLAEASATQAEVGGIQRAAEVTDRAQSVRRSEVVWLQDTPENRPIYELVAQFVQQANNQVFRLELKEFGDAFQLATYRAENAGFYGWHVDTGPGRLAFRKLSLIVPLTDPSEYEGGEFEVFYERKPQKVDLPLGRVIAFPSYLLHRVTPLTRGVRRSLAVWVSGPPYR
jgi:PKHD-type hydroxylase